MSPVRPDLWAPGGLSAASESATIRSGADAVLRTSHQTEMTCLVLESSVSEFKMKLKENAE